ncbi:CHASE domain-containing protein [Azospirillum halopraeferens]|uniref:CHASE domain-containing protein n=1 Tax=Azospirillum halopraeferens TaxID=34010 RepID=UPI00041A1740|nr:CHASE domain-containing protein [Azospirillum halopraeferens]
MTGSRRLRQRLWAPAREITAVVGLSLLLTGGATWMLYAEVERLAEARFTARTRDMAATLTGRLESYEQILRGGVALMRAAGPVDRETWRTYISALRVGEHYPGIQGIGFARRVLPDELAQHEAAVRAAGHPAYRVWPDGPREVYFPIDYLEPFDWRNQRAFGFDMFSEPARRTAMARARDTGLPSATGKVTLVQETERDVQAGFLLYLPYYGTVRPLRSAEERADAIRGFVYSPFRMRDLMDDVLSTGRLAEGLDVRIFDGPTIAETDTVLYGDPERPGGAYAVETTVEAFGRVWRIDVRSTPAFDRLIDRTAPAVVLMAGLIISLLLGAVSRSLIAERRRAVALRASLESAARAQAEAEHANAAKSRFLAAASHDLRQPLQSLDVYLHLLGVHATSDTARPLIAGATDAFETARSQLNAIMDIAELEAGMVRPQAVPMRLDTLLHHLADNIRPEVENKGLALRVRTVPVEIVGDPGMTGRMITALLHNALKYTGSGAILLACRPVRSGVAVKVQDTGPGIPPDRRRLIFEDFYQVGNPERDRTKGLGLGLATVARLARLLGCRVHVLSRPGRGAVFTVTLPLARTSVSGDGDGP